MKSVVFFFFVILLVPRAAFAHAVGDAVLIHMSDSGYDPKEIVITQGQIVEFENVGTKERWPASNIHPTHRVYPNTDIADCNTDKEQTMFDACRGIKPGQSYRFQFNEVGEWRFHDHLNASLNGKIIVQAGDAVMPPPAVENTDTREVGFFTQLWRNIKAFFRNLFGRSDPETGTNTEDDEEHIYNENVARDDATLFQDDNALYSYIKKYKPEAALARIEELQSQYGSCHDRAHYVGRYAYELYDAEAFRMCDTRCQSGCYHGSVEAYFREHGTANLGDDLGRLCKDEHNPFIQHQCLHGVGHGLMAWSDYELFEALTGCDELPFGQESCYGGVFMENIAQSMASFIGLDGHVTNYLSDDPHYPCNAVEDKYKSQCYFLQTDRFIQLFGSDFSRVAKACAEVSNSFIRRMCFESMGRTVGGHNRGNPSGAIAACSNALPGSDRLGCINGAVQDTFWDPSGQHNALNFCKLLSASDEKQTCYTTIFGRAPQVLSTKNDLKAFCDRSEVAYRNECYQWAQI